MSRPTGADDASATSSRPPPRVLVVDDHPDGATVLGQILEMHGFDVRTVHDGASALAAVDGGFRADHAVLDLGLPDMTGVDLAASLRARLGRDVRLVAMTGHSASQESAKADASEFDAHLLKPIDLPSLLEALGL